MNASNTRRGNWMQVASGTPYWPLDPRADEVRIGDVAESLSKMCRYAGHCRGFYSVAEHSVLVSYSTPQVRSIALRALLHDATEAYLVDVPRPIKHSLTNYDAIEALNWLAICRHFGLDTTLHGMSIDRAHVKPADNAVLLAEKAVLMDPVPTDWEITGTAAAVRIRRLSPARARRRFMRRYRELTGQSTRLDKVLNTWDAVVSGITGKRQ